MTICQTFHRLSDETWRRTIDAYETGLSWSEESNTENILLALRKEHPSQITIVSVSKRREGKIGADWEWWFAGRGGDGYGMRVQAKRISLPSETFKSLHYHTKGAPCDQMSALICRAIRDGLVPAYCFYVASLRREENSFCRKIGPMYRGLSGCLIGHAQLVQRFGDNDLDALRPILLPWHELVCDCRAADARDAAGAAQAAVTRLASSGLAGDVRGRSGEGGAFLGSRREIPDYVRRIRDRSAGVRDADALLNERGLRGIVVFQDLS